MAFNTSPISSSGQSLPLTDVPQIPVIPNDALSLSPPDPLEGILSLSNAEIYRNGIPLDLLTVWRDRFYDDIDRENATTLLKLSQDDAWAYDPSFFVTSKKGMQIGIDESGQFFIKQATHRDHFLNAFHHMRFPAFWEKGDKLNDVFLSLYRVHLIVAFPKNCPVEQVFLKLMDCVVEKIVDKTPSLKENSVFTFELPQSETHEVAKFKRLCCYQTVKGWLVGDFSVLPELTVHVVKFNTNNTKKLVLDHNDLPLFRPSVVIEASSVLNIHGQPTKNVKVDITLCKGPRELYNGEQNAATFCFYIDLEQSPLKMEKFKQNAPWITDSSELVDFEDIESIKKEAELIFEVYQMQLTSPFYAKPSTHVAFELAPPQTRLDKFWVLVGLLTECTTNPTGYTKEISYLAEKLDCSFSEEELVQLCESKEAELTSEGCHVSPGAVANKLLTSVKAQFLELINTAPTPAKILPEATVQPSDAPKKREVANVGSSVPLEPVATPANVAKKSVVLQKPSEPATLPAKQKEDAETQRRLLEKQVEKARRRESYEQKQRELVAEAYQKRATEKPRPSLFTLDFEEKQQVASIYKGYPMKAKDFTTFAMSLLRKKAEALGGTLHQNTAGSHPKLHFKRADGTSGGVTFRIHHGGDDHGVPSKQKDTLDRIFQL